jgi:hypothetical protein
MCASTSFSAQHFTVTNQSSCLALCAKVVEVFYTTGVISDELADAFQSLRVTLDFSATPSEIEMANSAENIEKAKHKKACELDNIDMTSFWIDSMAKGGGLDPNSALDVFKYAASMSDHKTPTPEWLVVQLQKAGLAPTAANKIVVLKNQALNVKWLKANNVVVPHPQLASYAETGLTKRMMIMIRSRMETTRQRRRRKNDDGEYVAVVRCDGRTRKNG